MATRKARKAPKAGNRRANAKLAKSKDAAGFASIFMSYSHIDTQWTQLFRKELRGALFNRADVWTDADIGGGSDWSDRLNNELARAKVALILASPDYLESAWCRKELEYIGAKFRGQIIKKVFWVEVRPCAWKQTELARYQRSGSSTARKTSQRAEIETETRDPRLRPDDPSSHLLRRTHRPLALLRLQHF